MVPQLLLPRLVPVVVLDDVERAQDLGDALVSGGLPCAEVTFRTTAAAAAIRVLARRDDMLVGAGTVLRPDQVDAAVDAGARFVVSPGLDASVVNRCRERNVPALPGVATASELQWALNLGLTTLKFFPAEAMGGLATVKALAAPFPEVRFVPTGGVNRDNAPAYLAHPSVAAVGGSWMVAPDLVRAGAFDEITRRTRDAVALASPAS
jgi:2-dehydro-3-deoxyphosphogluconate aldolase / (4S)-4-hydroxy-2-oxoglutarate aldolase